MLIVGAAGTGIGFFLLGWLASQEGFYRVFGYPNGELAAAFLLFGLASGVLGFWLGPLSNALSRRFEYQADAYAARMLGTARPLISALRKLSRENLSNLNPHWLYSLVYYSHPTLVERESALSAGFPLAANGPGTDPPAVVQTPLPVPGGGTR
jgi:STE24 endopeptidase